MIESQFNSDSGYLETRLFGDVTKSEVVDYVSELRDPANNYPSKLKIITDATEAEMGFSRKELGDILDVVNAHPGIYTSIKDAMIMTNPRATAFSMIIELFTKKSPYQVKIFSTREAATEWLAGQQ